MIIKSVTVRNFRSIRESTLECSPLTALVGPNGAGKSSFLRALELFYAPKPIFGNEDFYNNDTSQDIEISVTFVELEDDAKKLFAPYLEKDVLSVTRVFSISGGPSAALYGSRLQNPDFREARSAANARETTQRYKDLKANPKYAELPTASSERAALDALRAYEASHPESCVQERDDGRFFGFAEVATGYLGRFTRFIPIPAVRDAATDAAEGRGSPITELMNLVVRSTLAGRTEITNLKEETESKYQEIIKGITQVAKGELEQSLTQTLKAYVPEARVSLELRPGNIEVPPPAADVKLTEDAYPVAVIRTGHGLQRAFILAMLHYLAMVRSSIETRATTPSASAEGTNPAKPEAPNERVVTSPALILGIEEPELYQHPSRQRHLANILLQLASGKIPGVAGRTQVIYTTHSPLLVGLDRFNQIRVLRKVHDDPVKPRLTKVTQVDGDSVAEELWQATDVEDRSQNKFTWDTLQPRLRSIMTPWMGEGFFAGVTVLVEGEDDRAAILGVARSMGHDLESQGIAVIPCGGKSNLDRPLIIFRRFDIRTYVVWDGDYDGDYESTESHPDENRRLLRLLGKDPEDFPDTLVSPKFACFKRKLEATLQEEIGGDFYRLLIECQNRLGISKRKHALKNPSVIEELVTEAGKLGRSCPTLQQIVTSVLALNTLN